MSRLLLCLMLLSAAEARAQATEESGPESTHPHHRHRHRRPSDASQPSLKPKVPPENFELLGAPPPAVAPAQEELTAEKAEQIRTRRKMLELHQLLGVATLASLAATDIVGQLELTDKYGGGGDTGRYLSWHIGLATGTSVLFTSVGLLGVLAPVPFAKHAGFDTVRFHELMMGIATLGMLTQVGMGIYTTSREGHLDQRAWAEAHQFTGYATFGAMSIGAVGLTF